MKRPFIAILALLLAVGAASAETAIYSFPCEEPPAVLTDTAMRVAEGEAELTLTFGGDCTLGGETSGGAGRFLKMMKAKGYAYPFANLLPLLSTDDLTLMNIEGVLSDDNLTPVKKQFNFIGKAAYTAILTEGSVEAVTLANNHALDYGAQGKADTIAALEAANIAYVDANTVTVLDKDGVRIGITASTMGLNQEQWLAQAKALRDVGCAAIVHVMHMGEEYADKPTAAQRSTARFLAEHGVALVVGHHPHVLQGVTQMGETVVAYSVGNCVFGGNTDPKDYDACLLRATLHFTDGTLQSQQTALWPICISGAKRRNDYQPVLLQGEEAQRVADKIQAISDIPIAPFLDGQGAALPEIEWR